MTTKFKTALEKELYEALLEMKKQLTILHDYAVYIRAQLLMDNPQITYIDLDSLDDARIARGMATAALAKADGEQ